MIDLNSSRVANIICKTLNKVDGRLIDHGMRVAWIGTHMLYEKGGYTEKEIRKLGFLFLMHDVGAYKTDEINELLKFESMGVWNHSVYGYIFVKTLSPFKEYAGAVLFHHTDREKLEKYAPQLMLLAQIVNISDRMDILCSYGGLDSAAAFARLKEQEGHKYESGVLDLLEAVLKRKSLDACFKSGDYLRQMDRVWGCEQLDKQEILEYLYMVIYAIDFRSVHTVNHTITTTSISTELAKALMLPKQSVEQVHYGALLHDLGKIGIPVEILEYPGKLSPQAMSIMRTHVTLTEEILKGSVEEKVLNIAIRHHEKLDGSGYPYGLTAKDLSIEEQIVAVADIISALAGTRSYKEAFPKEKIITILTEMRNSGKISRTVTNMFISRYDEMMQQVHINCRPVLDIYHRIQKDYEHVLRVCEQL